MKNSYNIVLFGMNPYTDWRKGFNTRNLQVLDHLQRFDEVENILYIDFLPFTWKRAARHYVQNILFGFKNRNTMFGDLTSRCTQISSKILVYSTVDSMFKKETVINEIKTVCERLEFDDYILWSNNPMFASAFMDLPAKLKVFDAIDNWLEHPSYSMHKDRLAKNYKLIASKADVIFTVADELVNFFQGLGREKDTHFIANGVDLESYENLNVKIPEDIKNLPKPIITYIGHIQNRVDLEILEHVFKSNPDKSFVMIGQTWPVYLKSLREKSPEVKLMDKYKNVHYLGRKPYAEAIKYMLNSDVLIIPHREDKFLKYTSPTKLFQFLAAGKPVVSTRGAGVEYFSKYCHIASTKNDFQNKLKIALSETGDNKLSEARKAAVSEHSWHNRVSKMLEIIGKKGYN